LLDAVVREEDDVVVHILQHSADGEKVQGEVDWARRFDHMQQHTGQHILSAAFEQVLDAETVGFHMGTETCTIDLNVVRLDSKTIEPVETLCNRVVWEDRPVNMHFAGPDELAALPLRRPPTVEGPVRIIEIAASAPGSQRVFDVNPCGGTHVTRTGEIGLIKVVRLDYRGDETRVEFLCGGRALRDYRAKNGIVSQLSARLTVGHMELDQAVERLQGEAKQLRQDLRRARKHLLEVEADELAEAAVAHGPYRVVLRVWQGREPGELRALAQKLAQRSATVALLAGVDQRAHLCFACSEGLDVDMASLLREACAELGGKGGGQPQLAQGSGPVTDLASIEAAVSGILPGLESEP
jgi:alanyl-tRNA synthetase